MNICQSQHKFLINRKQITLSGMVLATPRATHARHVTILGILLEYRVHQIFFQRCFTFFLEFRMIFFKSKFFSENKALQLIESDY